MDDQDKTGRHPKGGYVEVTTVTRRRTLHIREAVAADTPEEVERAREAAIRKAEAAHREDESAILEEEAEARGRDVVMEPDDPDGHFVGWCNATAGADHWVGLDAVTPAAAAMLLCGLKPDEESIGSAERAASDCTDGDDFKKLRRLFEVEDQGDPRRRTLADWLSIAKDRGAKHHPWVSRYLGITTPALDPVAALDGAQVQGQAVAAPPPAPASEPTQELPDAPRRLAALRMLGGDVKWLHGEWRITGIDALETQERGQKRKRTSQKTIRADLREAAEAEHKAKREGLKPAPWHP